MADRDLIQAKIGRLREGAEEHVPDALQEEFERALRCLEERARDVLHIDPSGLVEAAHSRMAGQDAEAAVEALFHECEELAAKFGVPPCPCESHPKVFHADRMVAEKPANPAWY